jgi:hypothetical protein
MSVLIGLAVVMGAAVVVQAVQTRPVPLTGAPMAGALATALFGVAAASFTVQARWGRPAAYAGLVLAAAFAFLGVDRRALALRHALTEVTARATPEKETELGGQAYSLRVSPEGRHFVAMQTPVYRPGVRPRPILVTGLVGGRPRETGGADAEFVDDARLLIVTALDRGVELRLERVDSVGVLWADTLADATMSDPRLMIDRDHGGWVIVGTDGDNDRTAVFTGRIGEKGGGLRSSIPDTIPMTGEPTVFDGGATLVFPSYPDAIRAAREQPARCRYCRCRSSAETCRRWALAGPRGQRPIAHVGARTPQCGEPLGGKAACAVHRLNATSLYTMSLSGVVEEVAQLSLNEFRMRRWARVSGPRRDVRPRDRRDRPRGEAPDADRAPAERLVRVRGPSRARMGSYPRVRTQSTVRGRSYRLQGK